MMRQRIDPLIDERAPWLGKLGAHGAAIRRLVEKLLAYDETLRVGDAIKDQSARQIMATMGAQLAQHLKVDGLENIPRQGPALILANHPTGIADGIMLHHALAQIRPDLFIYTNQDVLRVLPQMDKLIVPVEWRKDKRSHSKARHTMQLTAKALEQGRLGVIFPSGRLAKRRGLRLFERPWMPSAAMIARKFDVPMIPVHIRARNSALFYLLDRLHPSLRDITLFHETLNKAKQPYRIRIGTQTSARALPAKSSEAIKIMRRETLALAGQDAPTVSLVRTSALLHSLS